MRLTLRTLLAYLDDTLDPTQTRQIGQKVAESEVATELVELIRKAARKRGLNVPPTTGPDRADPNTVAEYLDNDLSPEKVEEVEKQALQSEVHLAEIAACHQLLTLILSEPAQVPPTARQRMYGLAKGPEVDPARKAPRVASATMNPEIALPDEADYSPLISRRGGSKRLIAAGVLSLLLIGAVVATLQRHGGEPPPILPPGGALAANTSKESEKAKEPVKEPEKEPEKSKEAEKSKEVPKESDKPKETEKPKEPEKPVAPPVDLPAERKTSEDRKEVGKFVTQNGVLLLSPQAGALWQRVASGGGVNGVARLMSMPGTQAEVRLNDAVRLELWGVPVEAIVPHPTSPMFESVVDVFAPPAGFDGDLRLINGRVYLKAGKANGGRVRLRLGQDLFDLTFTDDNAEVLAETSAVYNGEPASKDPAGGVAPAATGNVAVTKGQVGVRVNMKPQTMLTMPGQAVISWGEKSGPNETTNELKELPPAWARQPVLKGVTRERTMELEALGKRVAKTLGDGTKDLKLAVAEVANERTAGGRAVAIYGQAALDDLAPILDALDDAQATEARPAAVLALQHWLGRDAGRDGRLYDALIKLKGFNPVRAEQALTLLHGFSAEDTKKPSTLVLVVDCMESDRLALRELAAWQIKLVDPEGAEKIQFQSTDAADKRQRAIQDWKKRIPAAGVSAGKSQ